MNKKHTESIWFDSEWKPPKMQFGAGLIPTVTDTKRKFIIVTAKDVWSLVKEKVTSSPLKVIFVSDANKATLERLERQTPKCELVCGVGGGVAMDGAKYLALKRQASLIQVPTIISNDAWISDPIGLREDHKIKYMGHVFPEKIVIDFDIIRKAPKRLNRYGACDILSVHTALFDWELATNRNQESRPAYNVKMGKKAKCLLSSLSGRKYEIYNVTEIGIRTLVDLYIRSIRLGQKLGSYRPQEGSEHFFAYNAEYVTKRQYMHGALLGLGIFVMSYLQNNNFEEVVSLMEDIGLEYQPIHFGFTRDDLGETLTSLREFCRQENLPYTIIDEAEINSEVIDRISQMLYD